VDLDGDGRTDILSGSYSRHSRPMAGLFQVLRGREGGGFAAAAVLEGTDGKPLEITADDAKDDTSIQKICTRAFAVDLDGDGKLDLVSGNFGGTFALFRGEGEGRFAPASTWLEGEDGPLRVQMHSDPFFVDWDGDGDQDLLSGSAQGGVFLFENTGSKTGPKFAAASTLLEPTGHGSDDRLGDAHITKPQSATRVWADDIDGDGKLDLLVGDSVSLSFPAEGVDEAEAKSKLAAWQAKQTKVFASMGGKGEPTKEQQAAFQKAYEALVHEREQFLRDERTGFVWVLLRK